MDNEDYQSDWGIDWDEIPLEEPNGDPIIAYDKAEEINNEEEENYEIFNLYVA